MRNTKGKQPKKKKRVTGGKHSLLQRPGVTPIFERSGTTKDVNL